jgi:hypothetical protein
MNHELDGLWVFASALESRDPAIATTRQPRGAILQAIRSIVVGRFIVSVRHKLESAGSFEVISAYVQRSR